MNKNDVKNLAAGVTHMVALKFTTVTEAQLFAFIASEQLAGRNHDMKEIQKGTGLAYSSISRVAYTLQKMGLLEYREVNGDRRRKIVHAVIR